MAIKLEKNELKEMRRISSLLYRKNKKYQQSIELSKLDNEYKDAIETCYESQQPELVEKLMRFFVDKNEKECFSACC